MAVREEEYGDRIILALRKKYRESLQGQQSAGREIQAGGKLVPLYREELFGGRCSMMLPETLADMDSRERTVKYRNQNRPPVIKTDRNGDASMTFSFLPASDGVEDAEPRERLGYIRDSMAKIWKQNVFYDSGQVEAGGAAVAWMDFRAWCLDGSLYGLLFLFRVGDGEVLGNFHCSFLQYDLWKPAVLKLLETVETDRQVKENGVRAAAAVRSDQESRTCEKTVQHKFVSAPHPQT